MPPPAVASSSSSLLQQDYNPPRKVKRLRELALKEPSQSSSEFHLSMLAPVADAQPPPPPATAPRRRGRKPSGPLSKSAREQLRKTNHSVIEKRRREKINEALAALRHLVPNEKPHDAEKNKEDKEFKLEILIRTVDYLRSVVDKMNHLERGLCQKCGGGLIPPPSSNISTSTSFCPPQEAEIRSGSLDYEQEPGSERRKRRFLQVEDDPAEGDFDDEPPEHYCRTTNVSSQSDIETFENGNADDIGSTRLPPISSWLPGSVLSSPILQLPSPPQSVPFAPTTMVTGALPDLSLPPPFGFPSHSLAIQSSSASSLVSCSPHIHTALEHGHTTGHAISHILNPPNSTLISPTFLPSPTSPYQIPQLTAKGRDLPRSTSPLSLNAVHQEMVQSPSSRDGKRWSGDERTAASLLLNLNMSSGRYSSSSASEDNSRKAALSTCTHHLMQAQTPSSMMGRLEHSGTPRCISEQVTLRRREE